MDDVRVAFATTCKNRAHHLIQTLPKNLADNPDHRFVVLDYGSEEALAQVLDPYLLRSDQLALYRYNVLGPFQMAHAKNMAHRLAMLEGGDILVNVDADNFTGRGFGDYVAMKFIQGPPRTFLWSHVIPGSGLRGCNGRIAVSAPAFLTVGGYDERYDTWGPDDKDFNLRLRRLGYQGAEIDIAYLRAIQHNDKMRFREYPEARQTVDESKFQLEHTNTIANYGDFGCGTVYRCFDPRPITLPRLPTRVFGIGMHKTATTSLHRAFQLLGYESAHWESGLWARDVWNEMTTLGRSQALERYYAACDLPIPMLFRELDRAYPGSKFILTLRDELSWLESVRRHWSYEHNPYRWQWDKFPVNNKLHKLLYGRTSFDSLTMLARYRRHNAEVVDYFRNRPDDLLVLQEPDWRELCKFLGKPIPSVPYPRENVIVLTPEMEVKE